MDEALELDLKELFRTLAKRAWVIVLCAVIMGTAVFGYTAKFVPPVYMASVSLYVNNNAGDTGTVSSSNLAVALQLVNTYVNIIESDTVLNKVIEETGLMLSAEQIRDMLTAEAVNDTEMFRVNITTGNPKMSADIANAIATVAPSEIAKIIEGSSAKVIDYAKVPTKQSAPNSVSNGLVGAVAGAVLAIVFYVLRMLTDVRVKNEEDLTKICKIPVLGSIPDFTEYTNKNEKKAGR